MSVVETLAAVVKPWADFYAHHKPVSAGITWAHLSALLVGGGAAVTADRRALALARAGIDERKQALLQFARTHRVVLTCLSVSALSGIAMLLSDVETFLVSPVYWTKMGLVVLLLANGYGLQRTEVRLAADPSPTNRLWKRFSLGAVASLALWLTTTLAGVVLMST